MFTYHRKKKTQESTSLSASYTQKGAKDWCDTYGDRNSVIIYDKGSTTAEECKQKCTEAGEDCKFYAVGSGSFANRCNIYKQECTKWKNDNMYPFIYYTKD